MFGWLFSCFKARSKERDRFPKEDSFIDSASTPLLSQEKKPKTIYVISLDADGVLLNENFNKYFKDIEDNMDIHAENSIYIHNLALVDHLFSRMKTLGCDETHVMVGSMRQSHSADNFNAARFETGCYFYWLENFCDYLNLELPNRYPKMKEVKLNRFLAADIECNTPHGFSFINALVDQDYSNINLNLVHPTWAGDKGKFSILYAQMHKMAKENPNVNIVFEFIDDHEETVNRLYWLFNDNKEFLPPNVTLNITRHYYTKGSPIIDESRPSIVAGKDNMIDHQYTYTTSKIKNQSDGDENFYNSEKVRDEILDFRRRINSEQAALFGEDINYYLNNVRLSVEELYARLLKKYMESDDGRLRVHLEGVLVEIRDLYHQYIISDDRCFSEYSQKVLDTFHFIQSVLSFVADLLDSSLIRTGVEANDLSTLVDSINTMMKSEDEFKTQSLILAIKGIYNIKTPLVAPRQLWLLQH